MSSYFEDDIIFVNLIGFHFNQLIAKYAASIHLLAKRLVEIGWKRLLIMIKSFSIMVRK